MSGPSPPAGNVYDKYGTADPVVRRLVARFLRTVDGLVDRMAPADLLDVGCGEGIVTERMVRRAGVARAVGLDRGGAALREHWERRAVPGRLEFVTGDAAALPYRGDAFDCVTALEVLMQVDDPDRALDELLRAARRHVLVSVPREPLFRALNLARGAYVRDLGLSPGSVRGWSRRGFATFCARHAGVLEVASADPWSLVLLDASGR